VSKPIVLRIGICGCTTQYHGKFDKQQFVVNGHSFQLSEYVIDEKNEDRALMETGCHFFIDQHFYRDSYCNSASTFETTLIKINLVSGKKNRLRFKLSKFLDIYKEEEWWSSKLPISVRRILNTIKKIISNLEDLKLKEWLKYKTPHRKKKPSHV